MNVMKWLLGVAVAAALAAPLQSAQAWGGDPAGRGDPAEYYRVPYRGDDYSGGYRGDYGYHRPYPGYHRYYHRHHRHDRPYGYDRGYRHDDRGYGYYGRPWVRSRGPVVGMPPPPPPPLPPW